MANEARALSEPWYKAVVVQGWVQEALSAAQWLTVVDVVRSGAAEVEQARAKAGFFTRTFRASQQPPLPSETWNLEVVPLLRVLAEDAKAGTMIEVRADLRGARLPDKVVASGRLPGGAKAPGGGKIRHIDETIYRDTWLTLAARLEDGTRVAVELTDRVRDRKVAKRTARGKYKTKKKAKASRRIEVEVGGRAEDFELVVPTPPPRLPVYAKPGASRPTVTARLDHPLPPPGGDRARLVLQALAEAHRHLHPRARGAA